LKGFQVQVHGVNETINAIDKRTKALNDRTVARESLKLASVIANDAQGRAPRGETGRLKRSLIAKILSGDNPPAIAAVDRKIAPHAHLVESGTSRAPAHPFFRPAVDAHAGKLGKQLRSFLEQQVEQ